MLAAAKKDLTKIGDRINLRRAWGHTKGHLPVPVKDPADLKIGYPWLQDTNAPSCIVLVNSVNSSAMLGIPQCRTTSIIIYV